MPWHMYDIYVKCLIKCIIQFPLLKKSKISQLFKTISIIHKYLKYKEHIENLT